MISPTKVTIASVTYRDLDATKAFCESVFQNTQEPYEFFMGVNGAVEKPLADYLVGLEQAGRLKLVWSFQNVGVRLFNTVMRLANTDYIFRCDSDVEIQEPYWTQRMRAQLEVSQREIGPVVAVGTSNTRGVQIQRTPNTIEVDLIMSNTVLIHKPTAMILRQKLLAELPRMEKTVLERIQRPEAYKGEYGDLDSVLSYVNNHAPYWDLNFGGLDDVTSYGSDDFLWSLLMRWAKLKLVKSNVKVLHKDASARPGYNDIRHKLVARGFCYLRTMLSVVMDEWSIEAWNDLPNNLPVLLSYRKSAVDLASVNL